MSAYIVDNETISALAKAFDVYEVSYKADNFVNTNNGIFVNVGRLRRDIGQSLLDQNYKSVNYRYNEDTPTPKFEYEDVEIDEGIVNGCIDCYNYQACETDDYFESDIYRSMLRLKNKMLERLIIRCGMDNDGWGYPVKQEPIPDDYEPEEEPDFIGNAPNYEKFETMGFSTEEVLCLLNID